MNSMVDWDLAVSLGSRLAGDGPVVTATEAEDAVATLRNDADRSTALVRDFTGLVAAERTAPVLVVDRPGWIQANADGFSAVLAPVIEKLTDKKGAPSGVSQAVGSRVTGAEVGLLLGFMASKVLGQFDPFHEPSGRLLLVAPNVVHVERELRADPADFRLWVCLHEETHRVQFTAVPWMREHLFGEMNALADTVEPTRLFDDGIKRISEAVRGEGSLIEALGTPEQREILDRVTAVMSLLEGHADVVMDGVGPDRDPVGRRHPAQVQPAAQGRRHPRPAAAPGPRARRQDGAVPRRREVRPRRGRQDRHGRVQRDLGTPREPPHQGRDRRPLRLGHPRPLAHVACTRPSPPCASPYGAGWPTSSRARR